MARTPPDPDKSRRFLLIAVVCAGFLVLAAGGFLALAMRDSPQGAAGTALSSMIGGPFALTDQNSGKFTDADLKGKWHLVFFGYTHCPDFCPTALNEIALALDKLGANKSKVGVVYISIDPERDTAEVLKDYVASFDAPIIALTGTPEEVARAAKSYRVYYAKHPRADGGYDMDHSALIYVMDPQGRFTASFTAADTADTIAARLRKLLS